MNLVRRVVEILVERFIASVGSLFAARVETVAALMHAEQQEELEERARQFEEDGKGHLAADLRSRASQLASATPGASGHELFEKLQSEHADLVVPRIAQATADDDKPDAAAADEPVEPATPRPARRRSCRRSKNS